MQVEVLDQFKTLGSSPASCAYHALRNGILLANSCIFPVQRQVLLTQLYDTDHMRFFLGNQGIWKTLIMKHRGEQKHEVGDWVDNVEIEQLINYELDFGIINHGRIDITTYGDQAEAQPEGMSEEEVKTWKQDFENIQLSREFNEIRRKVRAGNDFAAIVLLYVPNWGAPSFLEQIEESLREFFNLNARNKRKTLTDIHNQSSTSRGHWITLVVNSVNGWRQYIVTDSAENYSRLDDPIVHEAITLLEGVTKKPMSKIKQNETGAINPTLINSPRLSGINNTTKTVPTVAPNSIGHATVFPSINPRYNPSTLKSRGPVTKNSMLTKYLITSAMVGASAYAAYWLYKKKNSQANTERNTSSLANSDMRIM